MKNFLKSLFTLFLSVVLFNANGQTTITTTGITGGGLGSASPLPTGVTFSVVNNSGAPIIITDVGYSPPHSSNTQLWYSATSLTGPTGVVSSTSTSWNLLSTVTSPTTVGTTVITNNLFTGLNLLLPSNTTFRFAVLAQGTVRYCSTVPTQTVFTTNGVSLDITNTLWGGASFSPNGISVSNPQRYYFGSVTFIPAGPPCPAPTGLAATNILPTSATLSWNPVTGSTGYEYIVDQNATVPTPNTPTTTTNTSVNEGGLTPSTQYYLHVRNKCSNINKSPWVDYSFTTLPPCEPPINFHVTNLLPTSATINWDPWPSALTYDYIVDQSPNTPTSVTGAKNISATTDNLTGLSEYTLYYVHIRSNCVASMQSGWSLDSFRTPIPCRAPDIVIDHINTDQGVASWAPIPSAYEYEYAMSTSATPPAMGTKINKTSILMHALQDGKDHYIHVRSQCNSLGIAGTSPWGTATFKTFPVGVNTVTGEKLNMEAYPNPVKDVMVIRFNGKRNGTGTLVVTDISGRQIRSMQVNNDKVEIDLGAEPAGIYLVKYSDDLYSKIIKINRQ